MLLPSADTQRADSFTTSELLPKRKDMDAEKAKALFEGGGDLTKSEESTECLNPRSSVVALVRSRFESDIHRVGYSLSFAKFKNTTHRFWKSP